MASDFSTFQHVFHIVINIGCTNVEQINPSPFTLHQHQSSIINRFPVLVSYFLFKPLSYNKTAPVKGRLLSFVIRVSVVFGTYQGAPIGVIPHS